MATTALIIGPAFAAGANHGRVWETGLGGINVNAQVWIQASYSDNGKHASGEKTIKDSVLPGDRYVTHASWGYSWFGGGGCFSDEQAIIPPC